MANPFFAAVFTDGTVNAGNGLSGAVVQAANLGAAMTALEALVGKHSYQLIQLTTQPKLAGVNVSLNTALTAIQMKALTGSVNGATAWPILH